MLDIPTSYLFAALSLALYSCGVGMVGLYGLWRRREKKQLAVANNTTSWPPVSILKPLCGMDDQLEANLESFATVDYPTIQLVCCAADEDDPALEVARRVAARHPHREFVIATSPPSEAYSPKVHNLAAALSLARHELLLLSDSDTRLGHDDLRLLQRRLADHRIGYVYQPLAGVGEQTVGAAFENLRLNELPGMMCVGAKMLFRRDAVTGKSVLVRREALAAAGDFTGVGNAHNDDHLLAVRIRRAGWKLAIAPTAIETVHTTWSLARSLRRNLRHASGRWRLVPIVPVLEVLLNPIIVSLPLALDPVFGWTAWAGIVAGKTLLELLSLRVLRGRWLAGRYILLIPLKDFVSVGIVVGGLFSNRVEWRGKEYRMRWGSTMQPLESAETSIASRIT